ncbi:hypothetical protein DFQ30_004436 [Apophysomyces sp. BC1015]|nr:hypothetical protein DFQ30_004436 [Apophysomyces sp. BC1015]
MSVTETVLEIPIVLVHPVSMDPPPPGPYVIQTEETDATFARELLFNPTQEEERVEYNHDEERPRSSLPEGTTEGALVAPTPDRQPWKPLNKVKRKVSRWGVRLRPPGSLSNKEEVTTPTNEVVKSSSSHTTELYKTTGTALPTDIQHLRPEQLRSASSWTHLHQLIPATQLTQRRNTVREIIRFGHVRAAKQYGKQHGSMGNAGLDIRNMFNVPTAREAWQSCQAKVSFL